MPLMRVLPVVLAGLAVIGAAPGRSFGQAVDAGPGPVVEALPGLRVREASGLPGLRVPEASMSCLREPEIHPLGTKRLAQAKFAASQARAADLERQQLAAATGDFRSRFLLYMAGQGTLDILLSATLRLLDAERVVAADEADRRMALERYWGRVDLIDVTEAFRYDRGRVPIQDRRQTTYARREAEIWLAGVERAEGGPSSLIGGASSAVASDYWTNPLDARDMARARAQAALVKPAEAARAKVEAADEECEARLRLFLVGQGTQDILLEAARQLLESERALAADPDEEVAALEKYWSLVKFVELLNRRRYELDHIPAQDYAQARYFALEAEVRLADTQGRQGKQGPRAGAVRLPAKAEKDLARMKFQRAQANPRSLTLAVLGAARVQWVCRLNMFFAGQGTLCLLHEAAAKVLQAELAICSSDAERRLTLDRHWARLWRIEDIERARYEAGRVPYKDYMASKYERLATELILQRLGRAKERAP